MPVQINVPDGVYDSLQVMVLDGVYFRIRLYWNARANRWFMDLSTQNGDPIALGCTVVAETPLLNHVRGRANAPSGIVLALDSTGKDRDPGQDDWHRVQLVYVSDQEIKTAFQ